ncbi:neugrin -like protein, partial [Brachionus plicatilis]
MIRYLSKKIGTNLDVGILVTRGIRYANKPDKRNFDKAKEKNTLTVANLSGAKLRKFKLPLNLVNEEKKFILKGKSSHLTNNIGDDDPEALLKNEEDLDLYSMNENLYHTKIVDEDIRNKKRVKFGIIKKRIDKLEGLDEKYVNLLTWDAKEQIKHLHLSDPETWTPERISESFPITLISCKKLLKSKWAPKTLDELERHDEKVIQNWKMLKQLEDNPNSAGPSINIYREYKKMNKLNLLKNATGLTGINFERKSHIFSDSYAVHESLLCEPGSFSKIVVHKDNYVKKVFGRNLEEEEVKKGAKDHLTNDKDSFDEHLMFTK